MGKENVRVERGEVKININPTFYSYDSVTNVSKIFKKSFRTSIKNLEGGIIVTLKPNTATKKSNLENAGYEFFNYLLNETKARIRY